MAHLIQILLELKPDLHWLFTGQGVSPVDHPTRNGRACGIREVDARAGLSSTHEPISIPDQLWVLPDEYLSSLALDPSKSVIFEMVGDSMAPTIRAGDRLLVDTRYNIASPDGLYALHDAFGSIVVKRILSTVDGRLRVISDETAQFNEVVDLTAVHVVGRVVAAFNRLG